MISYSLPPADTCPSPNPPQVIYAGAVARAAPHFERLGYSAASSEISIADHMLDVAIKSPPEEVEQLVAEFQG